MKNFALVGAAGYIAPRHMKAIKDTGNNLIACMDKNDSVGVIDSYFPNSSFFTEFERFDRHLDKLKHKGQKIEYISITSPNYLHDAHIRYSLRYGADAICEKPLVLNPWNLDGLKAMEEETGRKVYNILQLRLHPSIINLKRKVESTLKENPDKVFDVDLTYLTSRGQWYFTSWKGDISKSGGVATNIGVHFFDMLGWIFGDCTNNIVNYCSNDTAAGFLEFKHARVRWFLSVNYKYVPETVKNLGQRTFREIVVEGEEIEFSGGFTDLHTTSYEHIFENEGFGLDEVRPSMEIVHSIRVLKPIGCLGDYHPFLSKVKDSE